jgi:hypothetical protein
MTHPGHLAEYLAGSERPVTSPDLVLHHGRGISWPAARVELVANSGGD